MSSASERLKDSLVAEVAADVLKLQDDVHVINQLCNQLVNSLPTHFDLLRAGLIKVLEEVDDGIKEAGGERIEFVKGQLSAHIERALGDGLAANSDHIAEVMKQFELQNQSAATRLKEQFNVTLEGMRQLEKGTGRSRLPKWAWVIIAFAIAAIIGTSTAAAVQYASYKEAVYMQLFMQQLEAEKGTGKK